MKPSLFITGSSGFIGRRLLERLEPADYDRICCLSRTENKNMEHYSQHGNFKFIKASILDTSLYAEDLSRSDIVIHLAAVTGKAKAAEYFKVNAKGTETFVKECEHAGIDKFAYMSTIAVNFRNKDRYYYAQSKQLGEEAVKKSTMNYIILRPTQVIGQGSGVWESLSKMARAPIPFVFRDGEVNVQPIYIDDLITGMMKMIQDHSFLNKCVEMGGGEVITVRNFVKRIYHFYHQKDPRILSIPLKYVIPLLGFIESPLHKVLPFTVGQLAFFRNDGTVQSNPGINRSLFEMKGVEEMLALTVQRENEQLEIKTAAHECKVFCNYLIGQNPSNYVSLKYQEFLKVKEVFVHLRGNVFDMKLNRIARVNSFLTRFADSYTRFFMKKSLLRKKLVYLLAILEVEETANRLLDVADRGGRVSFLSGLVVRMVVYFFVLLGSIALFGPFHLLFSIRPNQQLN